LTALVVVASHRRSGTHLVLDSLRRNALGVNPRFMTLERLDPRHERHLTVAQFDRRLRHRGGTVLVKTHTLPNAAAWRDPAAGAYASELLAEAPTLYVHRDGRDVLMSLYAYSASYSPKVAQQSLGEFIRGAHTGSDVAGLSRAAYWQHHVLAWLETVPAAVIGYADMLTDFQTTLTSLAERAGLPLREKLEPVGLEPPPSALVRLTRRARRAIGKPELRASTAIRPRTGGTGGWQAGFEPEDIAWFDGEASEAMRRLGYA
jgi:Sulfotransferase domain